MPRIISRTGNKRGTFAHKDISFEFASWVSAGFKLYLIKEFQRLKEDETNRLKLEWNLQRTLAKMNYRIHSDAIKENIVPARITRELVSFANGADIQNMALFGKSAQLWRNENQDIEGYIRDYPPRNNW